MSETFPAAGHLLPEESVAFVDGLPVLTYVRLGGHALPLVVFLPGGGHLARTGYGHPGARPEDFLAYWLVERGFGFLGLSCPSDHAVFPSAHPELTADRWGAAVADVTRRVVAEHGLGAGVAVCGWSMVARSVQPSRGLPGRPGSTCGASCRWPQRHRCLGSRRSGRVESL